MVYESGFTTRRSYTTSRPVVSSYAVTNRRPIKWNEYPYTPRPTLIEDPVTAFGVPRVERPNPSRYSILDPVNRAAIKPDTEVLNAPIGPYVSWRDQNRERTRSMVRQYIDTVEVGGNRAARTARDSLDAALPRAHRAVSVLSTYPVRRETYRDERSGALVTKYSM